MRPRTSDLGFTLLELLITVAIIGVLSVVGVPTFRRMVQKAKKSEAKIALGSISRFEIAFFAEYETYGNNLLQMGFDIEGSTHYTAMAEHTHLGRYNIGFTGGMSTCHSPNQAPFPASGTPAGDKVVASLAGWEVTSQSSYIWLHDTLPFNQCTATSISATTFTAMAGGIINSAFTGNPFTADYTEGDHWTINQDRQLANVFDGIK